MQENAERDVKRCKLDSADNQITYNTEKTFCDLVRSSSKSEWQLELLKRHETWLERNIIDR